MKIIFNVLEVKYYVWIWVVCIVFIGVIIVVNNWFFIMVFLEFFFLLFVVIVSWYGNLIIVLLVLFIMVLAMFVLYDYLLFVLFVIDVIYIVLIYLLLFCIMSILIDNFSVVFKVEEVVVEYDYFMGLLNLCGFFLIVEEEIVCIKCYYYFFIIVYIDIDDFKVINDIKGYCEGDMILCKLVKIIIIFFRESDYISCIGGDEFVCLLFEMK